MVSSDIQGSVPQRRIDLALSREYLSEAFAFGGTITMLQNCGGGTNRRVIFGAKSKDEVGVCCGRVRWIESL